VEENLYLSFVYLYIVVKDSLIKRGRVGILLTGLTCHLAVPVPSQDLDLIFNIICCALCSMSSINMRSDKIPKVLCTPRVTSHIRVPRDELSK